MLLNIFIFIYMVFLIMAEDMFRLPPEDLFRGKDRGGFLSPA